MEQSTRVLPPKFEPFDPELLFDPYPTYQRLRRMSAVCRGGPATWAITRYEEIAVLLRDPRLGHAFPESFSEMFRNLSVAPNTELQRVVSGLATPVHTRVRRLVGKALNPAIARQLKQRIQSDVYRRVAGAARAGRF